VDFIIQAFSAVLVVFKQIALTPSTTVYATRQHTAVNVSTTTPRHRTEHHVYLVSSVINASLRISVYSASRTASATLACVNVSPGTPTSIYQPTRRVSDVASTTRVRSRPTAVTPSSTVRAVWVVNVLAWVASTRMSTVRSVSKGRLVTSARTTQTVRQSSLAATVTWRRRPVSVFPVSSQHLMTHSVRRGW